MIFYHTPVLLSYIIKELIINPSGIYVDATFGGGGHSKAILECLNENAKLLALDQDEEAIKNNNIHDGRFELFHQNFKYLKNILRLKNITYISGVLVDLGVSSHQIDTPKRGFSMRFNHDLDMRMNSNSKKLAKDIINDYSEKELSNIFYNYGDLKEYKNIARIIIKERIKKPIKSTYDLIQLFDWNLSYKKKIKFLAKIFQAIRIEVNDEIETLKKFLFQCESIIEKNGRIAVISYHSIEDRLIKRFFKNGSFENVTIIDSFGNRKLSSFYQIHKKVIIPNKEELIINNRCRSAKLRIAQKV